jgi:hypothetical protein
VRTGGSIDTEDVQLSALMGLVVSRPGSLAALCVPDCTLAFAVGEEPWLDEAVAGFAGGAPAGVAGEQAASARMPADARTVVGIARR